MGFLIWDIRIRTDQHVSFIFQSEDTVGTNQTHTLNSSSIVGQVTSSNGSFINATVTMMRPINLNWSTIECNRDTLILNIPTWSGKFFVTNTEIGKGQGIICSHKMLLYIHLDFT